MSSDDFDIVAYRVLRYIDACTKGGVSPTVAQARELSKVGNSYLASVLESLSDGGYITGVDVNSYYDGTTDISFRNAHITMEGAGYLRDNSLMAKARKTLGSAFETVIEVAVSKLMSVTAIL